MKVNIGRSVRGSYVLLVEMPRVRRIRIGALGEVEFPRGFYAYAGSARGGLQARLNRHLRRTKSTRWHIDYLLKEGRVKGFVYASTKERLECRLAQRLEEIFSSHTGFGCGDCRCPSHLFFSQSLEELIENSREIFRNLLKGTEPFTEIVEPPSAHDSDLLITFC